LESKVANQEVCGQDSGCTAVLTLLNHKTKKIITANIGDSRGVLSRAGKAVALSFDHKPEDDIELTRIRKAGGYLTSDGRVKGGLNLSRAFGDHQYKQNRKLPLFEQMVTAKPDFTVHDLTEEDEFMIIACDGIWNSMTNQEAVNYVRDRLRKDEKISEIIQELFDLILAPDTDGHGFFNWATFGTFPDIWRHFKTFRNIERHFETYVETF
jgi:protein phosphatase 1G